MKSAIARWITDVSGSPEPSIVDFEIPSDCFRPSGLEDNLENAYLWRIEGFLFLSPCPTISYKVDTKNRNALSTVSWSWAVYVMNLHRPLGDSYSGTPNIQICHPVIAWQASNTYLVLLGGFDRRRVFLIFNMGHFTQWVQLDLIICKRRLKS